MNNTTEIYLIRHCEARGNIDRVFQGHTDADISDNGERQLERLTERFQPVHLDAVYSSPLKRARLTAQAVLGKKTLVIQTDPRIIEINGGVMEGVKWSDFGHLYKKQAEQWNLTPWEFAIDKGESMQEVYERMKAFLLETVQWNRGKTVAVCSHGCAIRNAICFAKGYPIERIAEIEWCDNTGVTLLRFTGSQCEVVYENDISHLDISLSTFAAQSWWKEDARKSMRFE